MMMKYSVNRENIKSLLPSLHWGSSHPWSQPAEAPSPKHRHAARSPTPPTSIMPSRLPTDKPFTLPGIPVLSSSAGPGPVFPISIQLSHFSPWEAPGAPSSALPQCPLRPPTPLSQLITLRIVAPGCGAVSSLSRL